MNAPNNNRTDSSPITDALQTYPLQRAPISLLPSVMKRLKALPEPIRPRFRIGWLEYAIGLFTTGMAGFSYLLWQSLPPQVLARLQVEWLIMLQRLAQVFSNLPPLSGG